jgi:chitin synthase
MQMHPRHEDTIVAAAACQTPCRFLPLGGRTHWQSTLGVVEEKVCDDDDAALMTSSPCIIGEFWSALDMIFETLKETQTWYVFCVNPNDSQLLNQPELEVHSVPL